MQVHRESCVYEIHIHGCAGVDEALALQAPISRVLCPDADHDGPCDMPWSFTFGDEPATLGDEPATDDATTTLVRAVYASGQRAVELAERVRAVVGGDRPTVVRRGDAARFEVLVEQYRIENDSHRG